METTIRHWLTVVARAAGLQGANELSMGSDAEIETAWNQVMEETGVGPRELAKVIAHHFKLDVADLGSRAPQAHNLIPGRLARRLGVLPLAYTDRSLDVATADPVSLHIERELGLITDRTVKYEVASPAEIRDAIEKTYDLDGEAARSASYEIPELGALGVSRILVVDDDPEMRILLRRALENGPFEVTEAEDGETALEKLEDGGIDLVTLDLNLPGMKGTEVLERIRRRPRSRELPVVVATGYGDPEIEISLFEAGADDFLVKPVDPRRFLLRVEAVLRRRSATRRLS